jgi:hypothetical protein
MSTIESPTTLNSDLVRDFVANAHGDLEAVSNALDSEPALANASWDWGGGDWKPGSEPAHMGRRDIPELLLANGARHDVFAAAMVGEVEVVRAILATKPAVRNSLGPHGIPLCAHAETGGEQARPVLELLDSDV